MRPTNIVNSDMIKQACLKTEITRFKDPESWLPKTPLTGSIALAMKGQILVNAIRDLLSDGHREIGCAVTTEADCLSYLRDQNNTTALLFCTDLLESGNGFELARKAYEVNKKHKTVLLALGNTIPIQYMNAPWLHAVVAETDFINECTPLHAAVTAVLSGDSYRSPHFRSSQSEYLSCPKLTHKEGEVLNLLAEGLSDVEIATRLKLTPETARTYSKRLLQTLEVNNRLQAVLKGMRCGMVAA